jgi:eukaryotic-like serine/threonine-protein kinase
MGEVYRARDTRLGRDIAMKISAERFSSRFEREARVIASLNHPNICTVHDVGPNYLVMELVEGQTLSAWLKGKALPPGQALRYGAEIADALAAAHAQGIVHRDLKPGNIMIAKTGVKVLDFGLAKMADRPGPTHSAETITLEHTVIGTLAYMAPEQLSGGECDARTDIFALGLILYEMIAGRPAFMGPSREALAAEVLRCQPPPLDGAPPLLSHVVARCLARDPAERW